MCPPGCCPVAFWEKSWREEELRPQGLVLPGRCHQRFSAHSPGSPPLPLNPGLQKWQWRQLRALLQAHASARTASLCSPFSRRDRKKSSGSSGWRRLMGSALSAQSCIPSFDPHPLKHHHSFHHTQLELGETMTGGPAGRRGWDVLASSPPPSKTDMSPLDVLGEIILTSTFVPGNQCV